MAYQFTPDLVTGNITIDSQHRQLFDAINRLLEACGQGKGKAEAEKTLQFLYSYVEKHFNDEERLQQQYKYPDYVNHKRYHEAYKEVIRNIIADFNKSGGITLALMSRVNQEIGSWLVNHVKVEDVKVAAHIKAAGK